MKRFLLIISFFFTTHLFAQESFNYQASILTKEGLPAANRQFRVSIKVGNDSFFIANFYQETIQVRSGNYGYLTFEVGKTGSENLSNSVEWSKDVYIELQLTTIDNLERIDIPIKHRLNFSPKAIYAIQAGKSLLTELAYKSINADTSAFSKTGAWALRSDSAKHSVNADTAQYSVVSKWSAKSDSSLHAINADTSAFSKTGAWALRSDSAKHSVNADTAQYSLVAKWSARTDSSLHAINADTAKFGSSLFGIGKIPAYALDVYGFGRFVADQTPTIGPELRFKGFRQEWVMGIDVANNGGGGDFVMLADQRSNGDVRDLIYVNRNKEGDNSANDDSGYPTIGFWATPASKNVQTLFTVPEIKPNRDIVGIRKGEATSNSKMLSFYGSEDSIPDLWISNRYEAGPFWNVRGDLTVLSDNAVNSNRLVLNANPTDNSTNFKLRNVFNPNVGNYFFKIQNHQENKDYFVINQATGKIAVGNAGFAEMLNVDGNINIVKLVADSLKAKSINGFVITNRNNQEVVTFGKNDSVSASFAGDVNVAGSLKNNGLNVINTADTSSLARKLVQIKNATNDYLLSITDINNLVAINSTLEKNIEVPNYTIVAFPIGSKITIVQEGIGKINILPSNGVTIKSANNKVKSKTQFSVLNLIKTDTDTWLLYGDLEL
jgi:hypothetical protein